MGINEFYHELEVSDNDVLIERIRKLLDGEPLKTIQNPKLTAEQNATAYKQFEFRLGYDDRLMSILRDPVYYPGTFGPGPRWI
jgi:hypothetical protein